MKSLQAYLLILTCAVACGDASGTAVDAGPQSVDSGFDASRPSLDAAVEADAGLADAALDAPARLERTYRPAIVGREMHTPGMTCDSICGTASGSCSDEASLCDGDLPYSLHRGWWAEDEALRDQQTDFFACPDEIPASRPGGNFRAPAPYFVAADCCCEVPETQWVNNRTDAPYSCDEVCEAVGLECGTHDLCLDDPRLCDTSFPMFNVQSVASYLREDGTGILEYPDCGDTPAGGSTLQTHRCACQ